MLTLTVRYLPDDNELQLVADGKAEEYVKNIIESSDGWVVLLTSQELVVNYVRLFVTRGLIAPSQVTFLFKDYEMFVDKFGHLDWWPAGFCDYNDKILEGLLSNSFLKE